MRGGGKGGKHSCEDRSDTSTQGIKGERLSLCQQQLSSSPHTPRLASASTRGCLTPSSGGRAGCVERTHSHPPTAPLGQVSLNWDNSQTSQGTHGNTLVSYYAVSSLTRIHLFPSCFIAEVRARPCLGRRSAASPQPTNADKLKVPFGFLKETALQCSSKF